MNPYVAQSQSPHPSRPPEDRARGRGRGPTRAGAPSPYLVPAIYQYRVRLREGWGTIAECARAPLTLDTTQGQRDTLESDGRTRFRPFVKVA